MDLNKLIADLKRRRVFRVAGVYLLVGWVCIQVADSTFPHLGLPEWMTRAVIVVVALGFPIALVLAWAFDITPQGVQRTDDIAGENVSGTSSPNAVSSVEPSFLGGRGAAQIGVGILIALVAFGAYSHFNSTPARSRLDSVAVLPFLDMSAAKDQEYFSDGISEELLNALSRVQGLRVPGRTSSFQFKGKNVDIRSIGTQLGVSAVLEGSVQKAGDKVRINARLTDATTGNILWSDKYDKQLTDIFAVQDEITRSIVDAMKLQMVGRQGADAPVAAAASNSAAHDAYLIGLYKLNRRTLPMLTEAAADFKKAVAADPGYVAAYAALAQVYGLLPQYGAPNAPALADTARMYAQEALKLDPNSAEAHAALGTMLCYLDWNYVAAERELKRAIQLNPNYATAHQWYGELLMVLGRGTEAVAEMSRAVALDPLSPLQHGMLANALSMVDTLAALGEYRQSLKLDSTFQRNYRDLGRFYLVAGHFDEAAALSARAARVLGQSNDSAALMMLKESSHNPVLRKSLLQSLEQSEHAVPTRPRSALVTGFRHALLQDYDGAFQWWNTAIDQRDPETLWIRLFVTRNAIRNDPRFTVLMHRMGLN